MDRYIADRYGERLDVFLSRAASISRAQAQKAIREGDAHVNGAAEKANYQLKAGETVSLALPAPAPLDTLPENIPLDIVYEDADIAVINKAQGMVVHPAPGNERGTLVNALLFALKDLSGIGGAIRPGIVHRIDKMTSGLLVAAKNDHAHTSLSTQLKDKSARRKYLAIVEGIIKEDSGTVDAPIGRSPTDRKRMAITKNGRPAVTHWSVKARMERHTLIEASLETGRTHQIRVHMKHIHHAIAGDTVYNSAKDRLGLIGQALHAFVLELTHPTTGKRMCFYAPPPEWFLLALKKAKWDGTEYWTENEEQP